jgi:hypothetical protein
VWSSSGRAPPVASPPESKKRTNGLPNVLLFRFILCYAEAILFGVGAKWILGQRPSAPLIPASKSAAAVLSAANLLTFAFLLFPLTVRLLQQLQQQSPPPPLPELQQTVSTQPSVLIAQS